LVAKQGITEKQAELTQKIQDSLLQEKNFIAEKRKAIGRYVRNVFTGFKTCRTREKTYVTDRIEVPIMGAYDDMSLMMRGFAPENIEDGSAVKSALSEDGLTFVGIADEREDGSSNNLLCTKCRETWQEHVYLRAINPRRIAIADPSRPAECQPHIHEYHYLTATELRKAGFSTKAIEELEKSGDKIFSTNQQNPGGTATPGQKSGRLKRPVYEVSESWLEVDWYSGLEERAFDETELRAFALEHGFPVDEYRYESCKWQVWHNKGKVLLGVASSYMLDKDEHPYDVESFVDADGEFCGNSQLERLSNPAVNKLAILNMTVQGLKKNLYLPTILSQTLGIPIDDLKRFNNHG